MSEEIPIPDPPLTPEEQARVAQLSEGELQSIDDALLANATRRWRKVAMVVGMTMMHDRNPAPGIPDIFFAQRVRRLVERGLLESQGNLEFMRFSEVRLPTLPGPGNAT